MKTITEFILEAANAEQIKTAVLDKLKAEESIFINGKYSEQRARFIKKLTQEAGYKKWIMLFLDKASIEDFGGISVPSKDKSKTETALPPWVKELVENPKDKYIVCMDFTGAKDDVINACMPIVLEHTICNKKFDNILIVGFGDINKLSKPMQSRFKPVIDA